MTELEQVPWLTLAAGDVVNIFHRVMPYRTKIGLRAQGTSADPVVINGVTDPNCNLPELSGQNAVTALDAVQAKFFNKQHSENLGVIFIYQASQDPWGYKPKHIVIQNLKISGAHKSNTYTAQDGSSGNYSLGAAGIYAVRVEGLVVQDNVITGNGNGVFVNSRDNDDYSSNVIIRRNRLFGNGNEGRYTEHNLYIQAVRPLYEGNYIGQLSAGAKGSSMKDRSSGTVIRYNHIVAAARAIDLVEIEGGVAAVLNDEHYNNAWVYGNLIVSDHDNPGVSSTLLIHWGGDNDPRYFRRGSLFFFNNTVVTSASRAQAYYLCIFDMPSAQQTVELRSNVIWHRGSSKMNLAYKSGKVVLLETNWLSRDWAKAWGNEASVEQRGATILEGTDPGLGSRFAPNPNSAVIDRGHRTATDARALAVAHQYEWEASLRPRPVRGAAADLGAFEAAQP